MNQILIAYEFLKKKIYDFKEAKIVWVKIQRDDWNYRQATLMIYVSADDMRRCKSLLIFKDKNDEKNSRIKKKMSQYHSKMIVQWNEKAYCNVTIMIRWLKSQYKFAIIELASNLSSRLLTLNVFVEQKTSEVFKISIQF